MSTNVPLRNIYVLLAFAAREIGLLSDADIGACDFDGDFDVLARLLDANLERIFVRGVHREYREHQDEGPQPRGTIDVGRTVARLLHIRGELAFREDDRIADTVPNRVLRAAARSMMAEPSLDLAVRRRLRRHMAMLTGVADVPARAALRLRAEVPRGNGAYRAGLQIARLCLARCLPDEGEAGDAWRRLLDDEERMGELFEAFVRGFARFHLGASADVRVKHLTWQHEGASERGASILPVMKTDLFVRWADGGATIGECKYYRTPLAKSPFGGPDKLRSGHLYQLMTYLRAGRRELGERPTGLMIYAQVGGPLWEAMTLEGSAVAVVMLDLTRPWEELRGELVAALELGRGELDATGSVGAG